MKIRPFTYNDKDYQALVALQNLIEPETPSSVAGWKHSDRTREEKYLFRRYLVEKDGDVVGAGMTGHTPWAYQPDKYFIMVQVHPDARRHGIGTNLYDYLVQQLMPRKPQKLVSHTREHQKEAIRFLKKRGFRQVMRIPVSRLDSASFDTARFAAKVEQTRRSGITVKTLQQLSEEDPHWKEKVYDLEWECVQDVPSSDPFTRISLENFEKRVLNSPNLLPDAWFIALDGDRYVGLSVLWRNLATDRLLETGLTGVIRSHRRRGIATLLKVQAIEYAREYGNAAIVTDNEENNPMFQLNLQLGFVPEPAHLDFEKRLQNMRPIKTAERADQRKAQPNP